MELNRRNFAASCATVGLGALLNNNVFGNDEREFNRKTIISQIISDKRINDLFNFITINKKAYIQNVPYRKVSCYSFIIEDTNFIDLFYKSLSYIYIDDDTELSFDVVEENGKNIIKYEILYRLTDYYD